MAAAVFAVAATAAWLLAAHSFHLTLDEGLYLEGGLRVARGQAPYRDFFTLTGPLTFWLEGLVFKTFGATLAHARIPMVADLGALTASVYWLTSRLTHRALGLAAAFIFFSCETALNFRLYANHRWDSGAWAMLAVVLAWESARGARRLTGFAAGLAAALAAWATPSLVLLVIALGMCLMWRKPVRGAAWSFAAGVALCSIAAAGALILQGALWPMIRDLLWATQHYPSANRVSYGYGAIPPGGLAKVFAGAAPADWPVRAFGLLTVLLPPALPIIVFALAITYGIAAKKNDDRAPNMTLLMIGAIALVLSTYPRWSADELLSVAPVFYVLFAFYASGLLRHRLARVIALSVALGLGAAALARSVIFARSLEPVETRAGLVRASRPTALVLRFFERAVPAQSTLFVYPYLPIVYFMTNTSNPTRSDFFQPGMMTARDAQTTVEELRAHPPERVFYFRFPASVYRSIWPNANPAALRPNAIDDWILAHYKLAAAFRHPVAEFDVLVPRGTE